MTESELKDRFNRFAIGVHKLTTRFPNLPVYQNINFQLIKSSSSSAANYHAACRAKSKADFINKLKIVEEELDESVFWMNYLVSIDKQWTNEAEPLLKEGNELLAIIVASINTAKGNQKVSKFQQSKISNPMLRPASLIHALQLSYHQIWNLKSAILNSHVFPELSLRS